MSVLLGRGDGTFLPAVAYTLGFMNMVVTAEEQQVGGPIPNSVAVGDFTTTTTSTSSPPTSDDNTVSVLLGRGDGSFQPAGPTPWGLPPMPWRWGISTTTATSTSSPPIGDNTVSVLLGRGDGTFLPAATYAVGGDLRVDAVAVGDFNHDGNLDIVTANESGACGSTTGTYGPGSVSVLVAQGDGTFLPTITYAVGTTPFP